MKPRKKRTGTTTSSLTRASDARRALAIERFITAWDKYGGKAEGLEDLNMAIDALVVSHLMANGGRHSVDPNWSWSDEEGRAMERLAEAWADHIPGTKTSKELMEALDSLSIAHTAATFEWASGPLQL